MATPNLGTVLRATARRIREREARVARLEKELAAMIRLYDEGDWFSDTVVDAARDALSAGAGEVVGRCSKCGSTPLSRHYGRPIPGEMRCNLCAEHCASSAEHVRCSCGDPRCNYDGHHGNTHHLAAGAGEGTTQEDTT